MGNNLISARVEYKQSKVVQRNAPKCNKKAAISGTPQEIPQRNLVIIRVIGRFGI